MRLNGLLGLLQDGNGFQLADITASSIAISYQLEHGSLRGLEKWYVVILSAPQFANIGNVFKYKVQNRLRDLEKGLNYSIPSSLLELARYQAKRELDEI